MAYNKKWHENKQGIWVNEQVNRELKLLRLELEKKNVHFLNMNDLIAYLLVQEKKRLK